MTHVSAFSWHFGGRGTRASVGAVPTILALHCTASSGRQWRVLIDEVGASARVIAPDIEALSVIGDTDCLDNVADEVLRLMRDTRGPVHLVGHSYGAALALRTAMKAPAQVAGLSLYEPTAFGLLKHAGPEGARAECEVKALASSIGALVDFGRLDQAMRAFVDYWQGSGSWLAMPADVRDRFAARAPRVVQDFRALLSDPMTLQDLQSLNVPALIISGEETALPTRVLSATVARSMPRARTATISGAGHMGPVTHANRVIPAIVSSIGLLPVPPVGRHLGSTQTGTDAAIENGRTVHSSDRPVISTQTIQG